MNVAKEQYSKDDNKWIEVGREEGIEIGREEGIQEGAYYAKRKLALRLLSKGESLERVSELIEINIEELETLRDIENIFLAKILNRY